MVWNTCVEQLKAGIGAYNLMNEWFARVWGKKTAYLYIFTRVVIRAMTVYYLLLTPITLNSSL